MKAVLLFFGFVLVCALPPVYQNDFKQKRERMVKDQIVARGIRDYMVVEAMRKVERHRLVPANQQRFAYEDRPLPIGNRQTISQPYIVAYMTDAIEPRPGMKVLEIGTGSGYQAAVLAEIVDEVYTIEYVEELGISASQKLRDMGYTNIHYKVGDGFFGWEEHAPYDAIIVTAAPKSIPPMLVEQLKTGGKMVIPVGSTSLAQSLKLITKKKDGSYTTRNLLPVRFVPFLRDQDQGGSR